MGKLKHKEVLHLAEVTVSDRTSGYISKLIIETDLTFTNVSTYSVSSKIQSIFKKCRNVVKLN